jgi:DNA invertase Pin-like site-specific DNA recombinase
MVMHSCDNPPCVNPAHLSVGTCADNLRDCAAKGRNLGNRTGRGGRSRSLDVELLRRLRDAGMTYRQMARAMNTTESTIWRNLNT